MLVRIPFNFFNQLVPRLSEGLQSLREAMIWTVPCVLISAIFITINYLLVVFQINAEFLTGLEDLTLMLSRLVPLVITTSLTYILSVKKHLPPMPVTILALTSSLMIYLDPTESFQGISAFMILIGIVVPFVTVNLIKALYEKKWTMFTRSELAGSNVKNALNLTIPGLVLLLTVFFGLKLTIYLMSFTDSAGLIDRILTKASYPGAILYTFLNSVLWFLGIHGGNVLQPLMLHLNEISAATGGFVNESFLGAFVFIGGSGATFSLILAMAFFSKNKTLRLLSYASVPIALMNINELLVFGLPIILNSRMFIPFLVVPLVNVVVAFGAIYLGWVSPPDAQVPFNALVGLNAYLATHHDIHAVFLQLFNVLIGTLIYSEFVQKMDNGSRGSSNIYIKSLDMTYTHINEEASLFSYDPISSANQLRRKSIKQKQHMEYLSKLEFYLEYQPQIAPHSHQFFGVEALLRAKDERGELVMPYVFLPWLEAAGMMKNIDLWVADAAVKQDKLWQAAGIAAPIKINVSGDTLVDKKNADLLVEKIRKANGRISIEIVEQDFSAGLENAKEVIAKIQRFGAKVYIDDFGTGYSSLSYLNSLNADAIKIDRSFVLGLNQPEGEKVMAGIFNFAEALGLEVVVEGVETEEQLAKIPQNIPFCVQGWLYSKALAADEIPSFIQRYPSIH